MAIIQLYEQRCKTTDTALFDLVRSFLENYRYNVKKDNFPIDIQRYIVGCEVQYLFTPTHNFSFGHVSYQAIDDDLAHSKEAWVKVECFVWEDWMGDQGGKELIYEFHDHVAAHLQKTFGGEILARMMPQALSEKPFPNFHDNTSGAMNHLIEYRNGELNTLGKIPSKKYACAQASISENTARKWARENLPELWARWTDKEYRPNPLKAQ